MRAKVIRSAFGRALEDKAFAETLQSDGGNLSFRCAGGFWVIHLRHTSQEVISGPRWSLPLGVELFRRWTGKEIDLADL